MIIVDIVRRNFIENGIKRLLDIFIALSTLIFLSPFFAIVALLIKITSKGPIFYTQTRVGRGGSEFEMIKFRSMVVNASEIKIDLSHANEMDGPVFKMKNDPRITYMAALLENTALTSFHRSSIY